MRWRAGLRAEHVDRAFGASIGAEVQAALLDRLGGFPPPAAGALVLAGDDGARAGIASDAGVTGGVERMLGQPVSRV
jgi:hypothetical protein